MKNISIVIGIIVVLLGGSWIGTYNGLVSSQEEVKGKWGAVKNVYQRRADLIPNLVETVKAYASHESKVFKEVTEARASVGNVNITGIEANPEAQKKLLESQGELSAALGKLMVIREAYPELKANQNFLSLQAQLEGSENRIAVERRGTQIATQEYNTKRLGFFSRMVAGFHGFKSIEYYEPETPGASTAPKVNF